MAASTNTQSGTIIQQQKQDFAFEKKATARGLDGYDTWLEQNPTGDRQAYRREMEQKGATRVGSTGVQRGGGDPSYPTDPHRSQGWQNPNNVRVLDPFAKGVDTQHALDLVPQTPGTTKLILPKGDTPAATALAARSNPALMPATPNVMAARSNAATTRAAQGESGRNFDIYRNVEVQPGVTGTSLFSKYGTGFMPDKPALTAPATTPATIPDAANTWTPQTPPAVTTPQTAVTPSTASTPAATIQPTATQPRGESPMDIALRNAARTTALNNRIQQSVLNEDIGSLARLGGSQNTDTSDLSIFSPYSTSGEEAMTGLPRILGGAVDPLALQRDRVASMRKASKLDDNALGEIHKQIKNRKQPASV